MTWEDVSLRITPASRALLVFLFAMAAVTFILAWRTYQGRTFYPFGLVLLALWSVVVMLQPLTLAPLAVVLAAILAVFLIQAGRPGETHGAWRQLLFPTLSVPFFLVAAWYIEQAPLNPDDQTPFRIAGWLLIAGFVLLLQPAPLHVAIPAVAGQAPPVVAAFLWIGGQAIILFLLQRFLVTYPWLSDAVDSARWLLWLGVFTALLGGVMTAAQHRLGRMIGYAALYDYGILIVALGLRGTAGLPTAIWLLLTRTFALFTLATGAAVIRHHMATDRLRPHPRRSLAAALGRDRADCRRLRARRAAADRAVRLALGIAATGRRERSRAGRCCCSSARSACWSASSAPARRASASCRSSPVEREPVGLAVVAVRPGRRRAAAGPLPAAAHRPGRGCHSPSVDPRTLNLIGFERPPAAIVSERLLPSPRSYRGDK